MTYNGFQSHPLLREAGLPLCFTTTVPGFPWGWFLGTREPIRQAQTGIGQRCTRTLLPNDPQSNSVLMESPPSTHQTPRRVDVRSYPMVVVFVFVMALGRPPRQLHNRASTAQENMHAGRHTPGKARLDGPYTRGGRVKPCRMRGRPFACLQHISITAFNS